MFLDEARLAARVRHPNVVPTIDVVTAEKENWKYISFFTIFKGINLKNKTLKVGLSQTISFYQNSHLANLSSPSFATGTPSS